MNHRDIESVVRVAAEPLPPLSGKTIQEIEEEYKDGPTLAKNIRNNPNDFTSKFLLDHVEFVRLTRGKVRTLHNLGRSGESRRYGPLKRRDKKERTKSAKSGKSAKVKGTVKTRETRSAKTAKTAKARPGSKGARAARRSRGTAGAEDSAATEGAEGAEARGGAAEAEAAESVAAGSATPAAAETVGAAESGVAAEPEAAAAATDLLGVAPEAREREDDDDFRSVAEVAAPSASSATGAPSSCVEKDDEDDFKSIIDVDMHQGSSSAAEEVVVDVDITQFRSKSEHGLNPIPEKDESNENGVREHKTPQVDQHVGRVSESAKDDKSAAPPSAKESAGIASPSPSGEDKSAKPSTAATEGTSTVPYAGSAAPGYESAAPEYESAAPAYESAAPEAPSPLPPSSEITTCGAKSSTVVGAGDDSAKTEGKDSAVEGVDATETKSPSGAATATTATAAGSAVAELDLKTETGSASEPIATVSAIAFGNQQSPAGSALANTANETEGANSANTDAVSTIKADDASGSIETKLHSADVPVQSPLHDESKPDSTSGTMSPGNASPVKTDGNTAAGSAVATDVNKVVSIDAGSGASSPGKAELEAGVSGAPSPLKTSPVAQSAATNGNLPVNEAALPPNTGKEAQHCETATSSKVGTAPISTTSGAASGKSVTTSKSTTSKKKKSDKKSKKATQSPISILSLGHGTAKSTDKPADNKPLSPVHSPKDAPAPAPNPPVEQTQVNSEPLLVNFMIHGIGGNVKHFEPLMYMLDILGEKYLAFDLPGFGESDHWADGYPMMEVVESIKELLDIMVLRPNQNNVRVRFFGHSMGCILLLHLAFRYGVNNLNAEKIILLAPPPPRTLKSKLDIVEPYLNLSLTFFKPFLIMLLKFIRTNFDQMKGLNSSGIKFFFSNMGNKYRKLNHFYDGVAVSTKSITEYLLGWQDLVNGPPVLDSGCTGHILVGSEDKVCPANATHYPDYSFRVIVNTGHNLFYDGASEALFEVYKLINQ
ncbi:AaceriADR046Cp [[Ashbya] aceris (nom. inval.)]|nr:AaceriADR046Cp [[Ashbya] aceris (nom. inval.)]